MRALSPIAFAAAGCNLVFEAIPDNRSPCAGQDGLVLCFDFEDKLDDGLATDRSRTGADALLGPGITAVERGLDNQAVHLDPGSRIEVPSVLVLDTLTTFTYDLVFQLDAPITTMTAPPMLLDHGPAYVMRLAGDGRAACALQGGAAVASDEPLSAGFHRITCVKADKLTMFVDGSQQNAAPDAPPMPDPTNQATFIGNDRSNGNPLVGIVDSVRIWSRPLTSKEIAESAEEPF